MRVRRGQDSDGALAVKSKLAPRCLDLGIQLRDPSRTAPWLPAPKNGLASSKRRGQRRKRPRAHHVRGKALGAFGEVFDAHRVNVHSGLGLARDLGRNAHFFRLLSTRCMRKSGLPASRMATTSPGNPAPEPRSSQSRAFGARARSWAESAKCRDQRAARVEAATRLVRACHWVSRFGVAGQPVDCFTWNFKGFREILRSTDGRRGLVARHLPSPSWAQALLAETPFFR